MSIVYLLKFPNGKVYVGKTAKTINQRVYEHWRCYKKGYPVQNAIRACGISAIATEILFENDDPELITLMECEQIAFRRSRDRKHGYNVAAGGDGGDIFGALPPEKKAAFREKAKARQQKRLLDPEYRKSLSFAGDRNPMFGRTHTEEVRRAQSDRAKRNPLDLSGERRDYFRKRVSEGRRKISPRTVDEWAQIKSDMRNGLSISKAMVKYGLKQTTAEALSVGRHWSCRETL